MNCVVCNRAFETADLRRKKTCCTACADENKRRMCRAKEARRKKRTRKRFCRGCGSDISHLKWIQYCGACAPPKSIKPQIYSSCTVCNSKFEVSGVRRKTCSPACAIENAKTVRLERRKRRNMYRYHNDPEFRKRQLKARIEKRSATFTAVKIFRRLQQGKLLKEEARLPDSYESRCCVCDILITGWMRSKTCSETCARVRAREYSRARYHNEPLYEHVRPPLETRCKLNKHKYRQKEELLKKEREAQQEREQRNKQNPDWRAMRRKQEAEWRAIGAAFRKLNLLPKQGSSS